MELLYLVAGIVIGGLVAWLWARSQEREARVRAETRLQETQLALVEQKQLLDQADQRLSDTFKALASDALQTNNRSFIELAQQSLETVVARARGDFAQREEAIKGLVSPLQEALKSYEGHVRSLEESRQKAYGSLEEQLRSLATTHQQLQKETSNLVTALRTPHVRGRWGELTLKRVAELSGMVEHCDFSEQVSTSTETERQRPDMIVQLPAGRQIVIDAKVALDAYLTGIEAATDEERVAALQQHVRQLRTHLGGLAAKSYWNQFPQAPEFVVMFIPGEAFLASAAQQDPGLIEEGLSQKVIIATPTTLIALLRAIAYGWRQEQVAQNAQQISEAGRQLYERMTTLVNHLSNIGRNLDRTMQSYNQAVASIESRVMPAARRLRELGASSDDELAALEPLTTAPRGLDAAETPKVP